MDNREAPSMTGLFASPDMRLYNARPDRSQMADTMSAAVDKVARVASRQYDASSRFFDETAQRFTVGLENQRQNAAQTFNTASEHMAALRDSARRGVEDAVRSERELRSSIAAKSADIIRYSKSTAKSTYSRAALQGSSAMSSLRSGADAVYLKLMGVQDFASGVLARRHAENAQPRERVEPHLGAVRDFSGSTASNPASSPVNDLSNIKSAASRVRNFAASMSLAAMVSVQSAALGLGAKVNKLGRFFTAGAKTFTGAFRRTTHAARSAVSSSPYAYALPIVGGLAAMLAAGHGHDISSFAHHVVQGGEGAFRFATKETLNLGHMAGQEASKLGHYASNGLHNVEGATNKALHASQKAFAHGAASLGHATAHGIHKVHAAIQSGLSISDKAATHAYHELVSKASHLMGASDQGQAIVKHASQAASHAVSHGAHAAHHTAHHAAHHVAHHAGHRTAADVLNDLSLHGAQAQNAGIFHADTVSAADQVVTAKVGAVTQTPLPPLHDLSAQSVHHAHSQALGSISGHGSFGQVQTTTPDGTALNTTTTGPVHHTTDPVLKGVGDAFNHLKQELADAEHSVPQRLIKF